MRLSIQINGEEPALHKIEDKMVIGSGTTSNVQLPPETGASRRHLQFDLEGDKVFVTDLGSTNGTFINDERLTPKVKKEFTTFFPIKIGEAVVISLTSDDEATAAGIKVAPLAQPKVPEAEAPQLTTTKTRNLPAKKAPAKAPSYRPAAKKEKGMSDSARMNMTIGLIALFAGGAVFYNWPMAEEAEPEATSVPVQTAAPVVPQNQLQEAQKPTLVPEGSGPSVEKAALTLADFKCTTELEKALCDVVPDARTSPGGVIENADHVIFIVPEEKYSLESFKTFSASPRYRLRLSAEERTTYLSAFFFQALGPYDWRKLEKNIFVVYYRTKEEGTYVSSLIGIVPTELDKLLGIIPSDIVQVITEARGGQYEIQKYLNHLRVIKPTDVVVAPPPPTSETTPPVPPPPQAPPVPPAPEVPVTTEAHEEASTP